MIKKTREIKQGKVCCCRVSKIGLTKISSMSKLKILI